jgi:hypothetical protein
MTPEQRMREKKVEGRGRINNARFPLRFFEVGEEMFFAGAPTNAITKRASDLRPMKFRVRQVQIRGIPGAYVWRIK